MIYLIKFKYTKGLYLDNARYFLDDANGSKVQVDIDYKNNTYTHIRIKGAGSSLRLLEKEVHKFALRLLKDKSRKNMAVRYN